MKGLGSHSPRSLHFLYLNLPMMSLTAPFTCERKLLTAIWFHNILIFRRMFTKASEFIRFVWYRTGRPKARFSAQAGQKMEVVDPWDWYLVCRIPLMLHLHTYYILQACLRILNISGERAKNTMLLEHTVVGAY